MSLNNYWANGKKIKGEIKAQSPKSAEEGNNKDQSRNEWNRD